MNEFGRRFRVSLFGESHGAGVGALLDGVPAGLPVGLQAMERDLAARQPGQPLTSQRKEPDRPQILSGLLDGHATGAPLAIWIPNEDAQSKPYQETAHLPRPGHADLANHAWSRGFADLRGGGHSSGRLTAPLVAAGAVAAGLLAHHGIQVAAHLHQAGAVVGPADAIPAARMLELAAASPVQTAHTALEPAFQAEIEAARRDRDSVGGVVAFCAEGLPASLGDPVMDSVESLLAHLLFAIPAVKGVSFGSGFAAAAMRGSRHNDPFHVEAGRVIPRSNHAGGILGGRTTGAPLWGHVAVKPAASLPGRAQETVDLRTMENARLELSGRHDPCIALRAVGVVQAAVRIVLADLALLAQEQGHLPAPTWRKT